MDRGGRRVEYLVSSPQETHELGRQWGQAALKNTLFCLFGGLGAGKTTLIKGIVAGICGKSEGIVASPTFVYLNLYSTAPLPVYHFDLYRLEGVEAFLSMGFEEYFYASGVTCIEWSEKIASLLPPKRSEIYLEGEGEKRVITYVENPV